MSYPRPKLTSHKAEGAPGTLRGVADRLRVEVDDVARAIQIARGLVGATIADLGVPTQGAGAITVTMQENLTAADINAALVRAGVRVNALVPVGDTLEDVFLHLVEGADVPR